MTLVSATTKQHTTVKTYNYPYTTITAAATDFVMLWMHLHLIMMRHVIDIKLYTITNVATKIEELIGLNGI